MDPLTNDQNTNQTPADDASAAAPVDPAMPANPTNDTDAPVGEALATPPADENAVSADSGTTPAPGAVDAEPVPAPETGDTGNADQPASETPEANQQFGSF